MCDTGIASKLEILKKVVFGAHGKVCACTFVCADMFVSTLVSIVRIPLVYQTFDRLLGHASRI